MHVAQIGTGRVGRPTAYTIMCAELADTITVCDTKPGLATAFCEELRHVVASLELNIEINACEKDEEVADADIILISAGKPRIPGVKMSRRDLVIQNAKIVNHISEITSTRNPNAKYIVITNPVDVMAMICKNTLKDNFVIGTSTNIESLRLRSKLARTLEGPISKIQGWVGGEHGDAAIILWSTTRINGLSLDEYTKSKSKFLNKAEIDSYMKSVSKSIVDNIGGTEYGPAASFRDITRAIVRNTNEVLSIAAPHRFDGIPEPVFVGLPTHLGQSIGYSVYDTLSHEEKKEIAEAAKIIYQVYQTAIATLEL